MATATPDPARAVVGLQAGAHKPAIPSALAQMLATCLEQVRALELPDLAESTHEPTHDPRWHE